MKQLLQELQNQLKGTLFFDDLHKTIYATDASVYRKIPLAVAYPSGNQDIQQLSKLKIFSLQITVFYNRGVTLNYFGDGSSYLVAYCLFYKFKNAQLKDS